MQEEQKKLTIERFEDGFQRNARQAVEDRITRVALELIASPNRLQNTEASEKTQNLWSIATSKHWQRFLPVALQLQQITLTVLSG